MSFSGKVREIEPGLSGAGRRIAIVSARFNPDICAGLYSACVAELNRLGVSGCYDALVAIGCVIRGETYHFEIVANESARGILEVQLKTGLPIANVVLTTEDDDQALARMSIKGTEAAQAAIEMANLLQAIR